MKITTQDNNSGHRKLMKRWDFYTWVQQSKKFWHIVSEEEVWNYNDDDYEDGSIRMKAGRNEEGGIWYMKVMISLLPPWQRRKHFDRVRNSGLERQTGYNKIKS